MLWAWCVINPPCTPPLSPVCMCCGLTRRGANTDLGEVLELSVNIDGPQWHTCSWGRWAAAGASAVTPMTRSSVKNLHTVTGHSLFVSGEIYSVQLLVTEVVNKCTGSMWQMRYKITDFQSATLYEIIILNLRGLSSKISYLRSWNQIISQNLLVDKWLKWLFSFLYLSQVKVFL